MQRSGDRQELVRVRVRNSKLTGVTGAQEGKDLERMRSGVAKRGIMQGLVDCGEDTGKPVRVPGKGK